MLKKFSEFRDFLGENYFKLFITICILLVVLFATDYLLTPYFKYSLPFNLNPFWLVLAFLFSLAITSYWGLLAGLYLVMAVFSFDKIAFVGGLRLPEVFFAGFLIVWAFQSFRQKKLICSFNKLSLPILIFILANFASLLGTDDLAISVKRIGIIIYLAFLFHVFPHLVKSKKDFVISLFFFSFPVVFSAIYSIFQILNPTYWHVIKYIGSNWAIADLARITAGYRDPNFLAMNIIVVLPILLAPYIAGIVKNKVVPIFSIFFLTTALYLAASRVGWLTGASVGFIIAIVLVRSLKSSFRLIQVAVVVVLAIFLANSLINFAQENAFPKSAKSNKVGEVLEKRAESVAKLDSESIGDRLNAYKAAIFMARDHPLFGVGVDRFSYNYNKYIERSKTKYPSVSAHNIYLETLAEKGIFGLFALLWIVFLSIFILIKSYLKASANDKVFVASILASLSGFLISTLFLTGLYELFFWFTLGFVIILNQIYLVKYENELSKK